MCGIAGLIDFRHTSNEEINRGMGKCMPHRGPDGHGEYFEQFEAYQIGFAHRRLSIIDLSTHASQPMHFDKFSIVFNGEIYNFNEIRNELISLGHTFKSHSDTEVILHSWKQWGEAAIKKWHGMFAIVLFDREIQSLTFIRDRAGVKPIYYFFDGALFLFGSELKCLMAHPGFPKEIQKDAVASFLQYGYVSGPHSIFKKTYKLNPGHLLKLNLQTKETEIKQYWNVYDCYNRPKLNIGLPEAIQETESILKKAFDYRMVSDVPVGVFLSGGYDSTCVTALLQRDKTEKLKTFTIGSTDDKLNEAPFAKQIAQHLGTDHTEYFCTAKEALDIIPELALYYDEPFADSSAIPTILVSRLARQEVTVALSADAGDEIFAGYNRYDYVSRYGKKLRNIPAGLRKAMATGMGLISSEQIPVLKNKANFHSRYDKLKNLLRNPSANELLKNLSIVFSDEEIKQIMNNDPEQLVTAHTSTEMDIRYYDEISYMMAIDYQTYMVDDILQKVDRATMSASLEGREPFLDHAIIEWAAQLPIDYKYHKGSKKYILKQIVHKYIPQSIMERPKMGFGIPVQQWLGVELKPLVQSYLSEKSIQEHGFFNSKAINRLVNNFFNGRSEKYLQIWYLLMFQMWYEKWMK